MNHRGRVDMGFEPGRGPGALVGSRAAQHIAGATLQRSFGAVLVVFALYFTVRQIISG